MTDIASLRPLAAVLVPALTVAGIVAAADRPNVRESLTGLAAVLTFGLVASMLPAALAGDAHVTDLGQFVPGVEFALRADALGLLFGFLATFLWIITSAYSVGYMRGLDEHSQTRYFASFAASIATAVGVAFASNLLVLFVFYELLTVATYPLVTHDETREARAAGRKYLAYTFIGGVAVLAGTVLVYWATGTVAFTPGGIEGLASADPAVARAAFALLAGGFGVKAALMPAHSWLPDAMVAPTPVSGLLHAVAVVKSGVFGIARVVLDVYGPATVGELGMGLPLAAVAAFTLLTASVVALRQDNLKRRLAFSTVSQLSYIVLGLAVLTPNALVGGLLHIPAHAFMKLTLFFCAGIVHVETHTDDISQMAGIGKRMPLTMTAFGIAAAGMAGIPFVAGFVSKFYLLIGTVDAGNVVFTVALLVSGVLNIAYFWPIVYQAFFESETPAGHDRKPLVENRIGGRDLTAPGGRGGVDSDRSAPTSTDGGASDGSERDGEYAVDRNPSDHLTDEATTDEVTDGERATESDETPPGLSDDRTVEDGHGDGVPDRDHHHRGGPPAGGWERRGWFGAESTWFMLGPILTAAAGSVVLGLVPHAALFLRLVERIVAAATGALAAGVIA